VRPLPARTTAVAGAAMALLALAPAAAAHAAPRAGATGARDRAFTSDYTFLDGVSCPAASFCMAVGAAVDTDNRLRTLAERWDGTAWHIVPTLNQGGPRDANELLSVSCASPASCMAVGDAQNGAVPLAEAWNGSAWSLLQTPVPPDGRDATLASVSCPASSSCVAAGSRNDHSGVPPATLIERWNGLRWTLVPSPNPSGSIASALWGISCASAAVCTAVGDFTVTNPNETTLVEQANGNTWTVVPSPGLPGRQTALYAVDCVSATVCKAAGAEYDNAGGNFVATPLTGRESGGTWHVSPAPYPAGTTYDLFGGVACVSAAACIATGSTMSSVAIRTLVESTSSGSWMIVASPNAPGTLSALEGISCVSADLCMAVGDNDNGSGQRLPLSEQWNGTAWAIVPAPNP